MHCTYIHNNPFTETSVIGEQNFSLGRTPTDYSKTEMSFVEICVSVPKVVILTTFGATSDVNLIKMTFPFQCIYISLPAPEY